MRVLIVDDHEVVRRGVCSVLMRQPDVELCGEAVDGNDAVEQAQQLKPDVIVMDMSMPGLNGLEATRKIRSMLPDCEILILSQHDSPEMVRQALNAGARGYVVKSSIVRDLLLAILKVSKHEYFFDPTILEQTPSSNIDVQEILQRSAAFEKALRESEELYRSTFELTPVGVAHVDPDGNWLRVNPRLCEIIGYSESELRSRTFKDITYPDDLAEDLEQAEKVKKRELETYSMEKRYLRKDGSLVWVNLTVSGVRNVDGSLKHFISVVEDISPRKQVEEALRDSQKQLALALASSKTAMFDWDVAESRGKWNPEMTAIYGFQPKDQYITAEEWRSLFHPEDVERLRVEAQVLWKEGDEFRFEFRTSPRNGKLKWVSSHGRIIRDQGGKAVRLIGIHTDISDRRALATGTRRQKALVRLADELHRATSLDDVFNASLNAILTALQCSRASILLLDETGVMHFQSWRGLSDQYRAAVDGHSVWSPEEPNPQPVCINDIRLADISESLKSTIATEGIKALAFIPLVAMGKLIGKFMVYFNEPHHFSQEEIDLSLTIARQLAFAVERKRSEEALRKSEQQFRRLSETLDAEVRLRTQELQDRNSEVMRQADQVRGLSQDLLRAQDEERRHIARELHDSAGQTLAVLGISLDRTVEEAGRTAPDVAKGLAEVQSLVQQLHREIRTASYLLHPPLLDESGLASALSWYVQGLAERTGIEITLNIDQNLARLPRDIELAIFRLIQECLTNIHRHSGSRTATIQIYFDEKNIRVDVSDQGKGIASERLAEVRAGGSGVGIRGMQERLRQFGGEMRLEATGSGTLVTARLPIPNPVTATDEHSARKENPESSHSQTPFLVPPASPRPVKPTLQC